MELALPASAEKEVSKAAQSGVGIWFWSTVFEVPLVSYLWTVAWIVSKFAVKKVAGENTKIKVFSTAQILVMILMDIVWFLAILLLVIIILEAVCHGAGVGSITAWFTRQAVKTGSLGQANFEFCKQVPEIKF